MITALSFSCTCQCTKKWRRSRQFRYFNRSRCAGQLEFFDGNVPLQKRESKAIILNALDWNDNGLLLKTDELPLEQALPPRKGQPMKPCMDRCRVRQSSFGLGNSYGPRSLAIRHNGAENHAICSSSNNLPICALFLLVGC